MHNRLKRLALELTHARTDHRRFHTATTVIVILMPGQPGQSGTVPFSPLQALAPERVPHLALHPACT